MVGFYGNKYIIKYLVEEIISSIKLSFILYIILYSALPEKASVFVARLFGNSEYCRRPV